MRTPRSLLAALPLALAAAACAGRPSPSTHSGGAAMTSRPNPFLAESPHTFGYPIFDRIQDADFLPAFERGMAEQIAEVERIANDPAPATFDNTLVALERTGRLLDRVSKVFFNLVNADTNDRREKLQAEVSPRLAAHADAIALNPKLFARIRALYDARATLGLDAEGTRLVERYYTYFVRAGAKLSDGDKSRMKEINAELARLETEFTQKVLAEVNASAVVVDSKEELAGLDEDRIAAAAEAAKERKLEGKYLLALLNTTGQPANTDLANRALRERVHKASVARGSRGNEHDTTAIVARVARLRAERARLLGYADHASFVLEDETAKTPAAVNARLAQLGPAAVANARREAAEIQKIVKKEGGTFRVEPWDWAFYSEKVRKERYDFDESQLKPYLELDRVMKDGVFYAATRLYGITFHERKDLPVYHPDVRVFDVADADGQPLALLVADFYARPSKRGGAWMNDYVSQSKLLGRKAVVAIHLNVTKPAEGQSALLTWDEVTAAFHEFGHALHGMLSDVRFPYFTGTNVPRDFVEYPSQVNEMWATWPEVLKNYAKHHKTGEPMPQALVQKVIDTQKFNQGYATTEYLAAAILDQRWHQLAPEQVPDAAGVMAFEAAALKNAGVDVAEVPPRYRTPYFSHIMGGYSAGYYAYIWSEVLDADTVEWFKENGGLTRQNGDRFRRMLLGRGGSADAMAIYREFRGRDPDIKPLLERRGLSLPAAGASTRKAAGAR